MQYNSEANNLDIVSEVDDLCSSTSTSYSINSKTRRMNQALETLVAKILNADGTWQFDDTNFTDLPVGTGTLVEAQESYSFSGEFLDIEYVKILNTDSKWVLLRPIDPQELRKSGEAIEEHFTDTGMPTHYDKFGDTIRLYPAPTSTAVTLASGIKVHFKRTGSLFDKDDTTKVPGIASPYHITLAKMIALPYCKVFKKDRVTQLERDIDDEIKQMLLFYSSRERDKRKVLRPRRVMNRRNNFGDNSNIWH